MKTSNYTLKLISPEESYKVRHPVLRPGRPFETCIFDGDTLESTFHFGVFLNNELLGICSFFKNNHKNLDYNTQYQLRGMAILNYQQGKGLGKLVLNFAENHIKSLGIKIVWCNAREVATKFYVKNDYSIFGEPFNIEGIGTHYAMFKVLN
ncbi:hypothetical protein PW52_08795 [Tamlana sedimentorum]|uniref:N-acetyltransferase domain-containing protein n=1 Tax=Neotamlana sedimentorum TaxID=1435349 RepID=A0A0D7WDL0_9FLAO|nr:hypothetical protein PW52_08795 [Tamlana sedimentorum]